jgi:radical SAM superfamily enzyme YgiQ (UPF0313 family)
MRRVLFIQPPFYRFLGIRSRYIPYQFCSMGAYLKEGGHEVRIFESDKTEVYGSLDFSGRKSIYSKYIDQLKSFSDPFWEELQKTVNEFNPDFIGITVWTTFIASAVRTAEFCRKVQPNAVIIGGGPHVTLRPDDIKKVSWFDIGVIGEGELTIREIVDGIPLPDVTGIFYWEKEAVKQNPPRPFCDDLDSFGMPDRTLLLNKGAYESEDMGLIMSARGCPFSCAYCATIIWAKKVRSRSVDSVIEEIKAIKAVYGTIYFTLKDDTFTVNKNRVREFCARLREEKLGIFWECNANLTTITREMLLDMRSAGCIAIKVGVETGSDRMHKIIGKGLTNESVQEKMKLFKGTGIHTTCYFMMGIPGEKREDILWTMEFAMKLKADYISISSYEVFPETDLHRMGIKEGSAKEHMSTKDYFSVQPQNYFYAGNIRNLSGMSREEFIELKDKFNSAVHKYNRRPRAILSRIRARTVLYRKKPYCFLEDIKRLLHWM